MGIKVGWENASHNIIRYEFIGQWEKADVDTTLDRTQKLIEHNNRNQPLHAIALIFHISTTDPSPVRVLVVVRSLIKVLQNDLKYFVIISDDMLLKTLIVLTDPFYRSFGVRLRTARSEEEAQKIILDGAKL